MYGYLERFTDTLILTWGHTCMVFVWNDPRDITGETAAAVIR